MINKSILISICFSLFGCSQNAPKKIVEKKVTITAAETPKEEQVVNEIILQKTLEWMSENEVEDICRRIAKLDITFVAPGAGITEGSYYVMRALIKKYSIAIPKAAMENKAICFCADSEENRAKNFQKAARAKEKIIWAIRGGFGSNMIINRLDKKPIPQVKKTLIGFSDTTSLNIFVSQKWGWRAIHAPVFIHLEKSEFSKGRFDTLLDILEGRIDSYEIQDVYPVNNIAKKRSKLSGPLTGGNLTIIESSLSTCWEIDTDNKILFIEDVNLNTWRILRAMYHLKETGKLKNVKGIIFGRFTKCTDSQKEIASLLCQIAMSLDIPVYVTDQFGHGNYNRPLVYGAIATLRDNKMIVDLKPDRKEEKEEEELQEEL